MEAHSGAFLSIPERFGPFLLLYTPDHTYAHQSFKSFAASEEAQGIIAQLVHRHSLGLRFLNFEVCFNPLYSGKPLNKYYCKL